MATKKFSDLSAAAQVRELVPALAVLVEQLAPEERVIRISRSDLRTMPALGVTFEVVDGEEVLVLAVGDTRRPRDFVLIPAPRTSVARATALLDLADASRCLVPVQPHVVAYLVERLGETVGTQVADAMRCGSPVRVNESALASFDALWADAPRAVADDARPFVLDVARGV